MTLAAPHIEALSGIRLETDVPLKRHTSFRVGGPARFLAFPATADDLICLVRAAREDKVPFCILGGGTNTLVSDAGIQGLVIGLTALTGGPELAGDTVRAGAGLTLASLCRFAMENSLSGLEWAAGIPGTLGGALKMNAGSFGSDMAAVTASIGVLDLDTLAVQTLLPQHLDFSYRNLKLENHVILGAELCLARGSQENIRVLHDRNLKIKKQTQPVSKASAGCFFKNPSPEQPAGRLIEQAGLKGYAFGGAMVSKLHANFIINHDNATCAQILGLAEKVRATVKEKFNINLEPEVKAIGS